MPVLEPVDVVIVTDGDQLLHLDLDVLGQLCIRDEVLRKTLCHIALAINCNHAKLKALERDASDANEAMEAVKQHTTRLDHRLTSCEESAQEVRIQLGTMMAQEESDDDGYDEYGKPRINPLSVEDDLDEAASPETVDEMHAKLEHLEKRLEDEARLREKGHQEVEYALQVLNGDVKERIENRLNELSKYCEDTKHECDGLQRGLSDTLSSRASKTEVAEVVHRLDQCIDDYRKEAHLRDKTVASLTKLDDCLSATATNKEKIEALLDAFHIETDGCREWCARNLSDLKSALQTIQSEVRQQGHEGVDELRAELRRSMLQMCEVTTRVESEICKKAEAGLVERMRSQIEELANKFEVKHQLLMGTRCLACDRGLDIGIQPVTDQPVDDADFDTRDKELFQDVSAAMRRSDGRSEEVLKYISVHVGGSGMVSGKNGGLYRARDDKLEGKVFVRTGSPATAALHVSSMSQGANPTPARSPARQVAPLIFSPARPEFGSRQEARPGTGRSSHYTVQHALTGGPRQLVDRSNNASSRTIAADAQQEQSRTATVEDLRKAADLDTSATSPMSIPLQPGATGHTRASEPPLAYSSLDLQHRAGMN
jgi:hypothetical protein